MSQDISSRPAGLPAKRKVYRFWGYRQGRKERGQKDICLSALPSSRSVALEVAPQRCSVFLPSICIVSFWIWGSRWAQFRY